MKNAKKCRPADSLTQETGSSSPACAGACNDEGEQHCSAVLGRPPISSRVFPVTTAAIVIVGGNVWISGSAGIHPCAAIGDSAVIASGSVVTKSTPANAVVEENSARVLRMLEQKI
uniref:hypothetical protein n=1 Tax=Candidatus Fimivicinus sp. TaxID=3056640 RepID=UPI003FEEC107